MLIKKFTPKEHYVKGLVYGKSGTGKTVFGGMADDCIIASAEDGLLSLSNFKSNIQYVTIESLEDMRGLFKYLKEEKHNYKTLVIDSISEISDRIQVGLEKKNANKQMTMQQWGELSRGINEILMDFKTLPMNLLVIAQEMIEKDEEKIIGIIPSLSGKMKTKIAYSFDIIGYLYTKEGTDIEGVRTVDRWTKTSMSEKLVTKDRTNMIGDRLNINFQDWIDAVKSIKTSDKEEVVKEVKPVEEVDVIEPVVEATPTEEIVAEIVVEKVEEEVSPDPLDKAMKGILEKGFIERIKKLQTEKILEIKDLQAIGVELRKEHKFERGSNVDAMMIEVYNEMKVKYLPA